MLNEPPKHLKDKYYLYAIWLEADYGSRPTDDLLIVHVERPVSFATFCDTYIFQHDELTVEKTGEKIKANRVVGIQKIPNNQEPKYTLTQAGVLK